MTTTSNHPGAGWHPDPWQQADLRYWDGAQWTHHTHRHAANQPNSAVAAPEPAASAAAAPVDQWAQPSSPTPHPQPTVRPGAGHHPSQPTYPATNATPTAGAPLNPQPIATPPAVAMPPTVAPTFAQPLEAQPEPSRPTGPPIAGEPHPTATSEPNPAPSSPAAAAGFGDYAEVQAALKGARWSNRLRTACYLFVGVASLAMYAEMYRVFAKYRTVNPDEWGLPAAVSNELEHLRWLLLILPIVYGVIAYLAEHSYHRWSPCAERLMRDRGLDAAPRVGVPITPLLPLEERSFLAFIGDPRQYRRTKVWVLVVGILPKLIWGATAVAAAYSELVGAAETRPRVVTLLALAITFPILAIYNEIVGRSTLKVVTEDLAPGRLGPSFQVPVGPPATASASATGPMRWS